MRSAGVRKRFATPRKSILQGIPEADHISAQKDDMADHNPIRQKYRLLLPAMGLAMLAAGASANVGVKPPFASSMVLQRNLANPIWGTADAGETVTITFGTQTKTATAGADGAWKTKLDPMAEAGPLTMTLKGRNTVTLNDIYVGEVWQVAGQSNMDTRMSFYPNLADSIRNANVPMMRYYTLRQPGETTTWLVVSPSTAGKLSATGYFFGKEIQKTTGIAVGLVVTAVGGTTVESWLDPATLAANTSINTADKGGNWRNWVSPVAGYGIRGTVWIQGEQNATSGSAGTYGERFKLIIKGWRAAWGQGDFPFYFGQLSSTSGTPAPNDASPVAQVREGQRQALSLPGTAMTVNMDIGVGDWHYPNKPEAGRRLSLPAKTLLYGNAGLEYSGPMYESMTLSGNQAKLVFNHTGTGLMAKGSLDNSFAIAGATGDWVWGQASINGDTVIVSSASIARPTRVRYAWANRPTVCLYNKEGLPASPFTTEAIVPTTYIKVRNRVRYRSITPADPFPKADVLGRRQARKRPGVPR
jgi:sialate O-acetylesterase